MKFRLKVIADLSMYGLPEKEFEKTEFLNRFGKKGLFLGDGYLSHQHLPYGAYLTPLDNPLFSDAIEDLQEEIQELDEHLEKVNQSILDDGTTTENSDSAKENPPKWVRVCGDLFKHFEHGSMLEYNPMTDCYAKVIKSEGTNYGLVSEIVMRNKNLFQVMNDGEYAEFIRENSPSDSADKTATEEQQQKIMQLHSKLNYVLPDFAAYLKNHHQTTWSRLTANKANEVIEDLQKKMDQLEAAKPKMEYPPAIVLLSNTSLDAGLVYLQSGIQSNKYTVDGIWSPDVFIDLDHISKEDWVACPADWNTRFNDKNFRSHIGDLPWPSEVQVTETIRAAFSNGADAVPGTVLHLITPRPSITYYSALDDGKIYKEKIQLHNMDFTKVVDISKAVSSQN